MIRIENIDCMEGLNALEDECADCIVTSPPYNKSYFNKISGTHNLVWSGAKIEYNSYSDDMPWTDYCNWMISFISICMAKLKPNGSMFFNHKPIRTCNAIVHPLEFLIKSNAAIYQEIIWDRRSSPNVRNDILVPCTERIYWLCKKGSKPRTYRDKLPAEYVGEVWNIKPETMKEHPAPFPLTLASNAILLTTKEGDTVIDPFMGSGTTGVASVALGRNFIGFEIDKGYFDFAKSRIENTPPPVKNASETAVSGLLF